MRIDQQRRFARSDEVPVRCGNGDEAAVRIDHILDRRAHGGAIGSKILERLRRADEASRLVQGERQEAYIPACDEIGKFVVVALPQPMQIGALRQGGRVDLDDRANHDDLPVRTCIGQCFDQREVDALIDHTKKTETWVRNMALRRVLVIRAPFRQARQPCARKVGRIDAAGKAVNLRIALAFGFIETSASREDQVCCLEQCALALQQLTRRILEGCQFVHAVVNDALRREFSSQWHRHGCVEPQPVGVDPVIGQVVGQENSQRRDVIVVKPRRCTRDVGTQYGDTLHRMHAFQRRHGRPCHRLLHEHDIEAIGQA